MCVIGGYIIIEIFLFDNIINNLLGSVLCFCISISVLRDISRNSTALIGGAPFITG